MNIYRFSVLCGSTSYRERRLLLVPHLLCEALEVSGVVVGVAHVLGDAPQVPVEEVRLMYTHFYREKAGTLAVYMSLFAGG